eukprot:9896861-Alexandrium_andersonii.AAC.1
MRAGDADAGQEGEWSVLDTTYAIRDVEQPVIALHVVPSIWAPLEPPMNLDRSEARQVAGCQTHAVHLDSDVS